MKGYHTGIATYSPSTESYFLTKFEITEVLRWYKILVRLVWVVSIRIIVVGFFVFWWVGGFVWVGVAIAVVLGVVPLVGFFVRTCTTSTWRITATLGLFLMGTLPTFTQIQIVALPAMVIGVLSIVTAPPLLKSVVFLFVVLVVVVSIVFGEVISICWIFARGLTALASWIAASFFVAAIWSDSLFHWKELRWALHTLTLVLLPCAFFMKAIVAGRTQKLFAIQALNGAFVFFALLTNSDSLVSDERLLLLRTPHPLHLRMLLKVALWAQKNLTVETLAINFAIFAELTSKIHS